MTNTGRCWRRKNKGIANPPCSVGEPSFLSRRTLPHWSGSTHKAGAARYPVTNWLNYSGGFPPSYDQYREMLEEEKDDC